MTAWPSRPHSPLGLGPWPGWPHAGPDPGLSPHPPEQSRPGLVDDLELGVFLVHTELIEGELFRLLDAAAGGLHPLHVDPHFFFLGAGFGTGRGTGRFAGRAAGPRTGLPLGAGGVAALGDGRGWGRLGVGRLPSPLAPLVFA